MIQSREYLDRNGRSPFDEWRASLDTPARAKVETALLRLQDGNTSHVKGLGGGLSELKIDFGPGYRVYFGWSGSTIVILLGGGVKKSQQADIEKARLRWADYKAGKSFGA
jgi:putative addiction module killer protein